MWDSAHPEERLRRHLFVLACIEEHFVAIGANLQRRREPPPDAPLKPPTLKNQMVVTGKRVVALRRVHGVDVFYC